MLHDRCYKVQIYEFVVFFSILCKHAMLEVQQNVNNVLNLNEKVVVMKKTK